MIKSFLACALVFCGCAAFSADLSLKVVDKEPPKELDESIRATLQKKAVQLLKGDKPAFEFWFRSEIPLQSISSALDSCREATLIGALSVPAASQDYREDQIASGIYTMRFALQPQDGNHLGTAEFPYFAVLTPAKVDNKLDAITDYKQLVKASSKETSTDHPVIVSLRPASSDAGEFPKLQEPAPEHKSVRVKIPAQAPGQKTSIVFDLVYEGKGKK